VKTVRDLCIKNHGRKPRDLLIVHVVGEFSELMLGKTPLIKYGDPGNPKVTVKIGQTFIPDVLVDLGATINIMPKEMTQLLQLRTQFLSLTMGYCKLMTVSHDTLVAMKTWKNNNMLTWRDYSRYFYNEFEYGVKR
jgi:hypothetical protein